VTPALHSARLKLNVLCSRRPLRHSSVSSGRRPPSSLFPPRAPHPLPPPSPLPAPLPRASSKVPRAVHALVSRAISARDFVHRAADDDAGWLAACHIVRRHRSMSFMYSVPLTSSRTNDCLVEQHGCRIICVQSGCAMTDIATSCSISPTLRHDACADCRSRSNALRKNRKKKRIRTFSKNDNHPR